MSGFTVYSILMQLAPIVVSDDGWWYDKSAKASIIGCSVINHPIMDGMNHPKMDASLQCNKSSNNGWHESSKNGCLITV